VDVIEWMELVRHCRSRKNVLEGKRGDPVASAAQRSGSAIPEGSIQQHHHTHLGHDQEK